VEVSGTNKKGVKFECDALLHNISEGGILMRITHGVKKGSELAVLLRPADSVIGEDVSPLASTAGTVLRTKRQPLDTCDVAVRFAEPLPAHFDMMGC
jgi:c-di-GMP-binding flagellar brake protein YcgR